MSRKCCLEVSRISEMSRECRRLVAPELLLRAELLLEVRLGLPGVG